MRSFAHSQSNLVAAASIVMLAFGSFVHADDTEIFMSQPASNIHANILLIIDTSGSMNETAESSPLPYDPTVPYDNSGTSCDSSRVYYWTQNSPPARAPTRCNEANVASFPLSHLKCSPALAALAWGSGATGPGFYSDRFIRWGGSGSNKSWNSSLNPNNARDVECKTDEGEHGPDSASSAKWPRSGNSSQTDGRYTSTASQTWWTGSNVGYSRTLYSANYIRYTRNPFRDVQTRMDVVKAAAASFLNSLPNVNIGVMRYSTNSHSYGSADSTASGGMVMSPISPINDKRAALIEEITTSNRYEPHGWTPMSETLFEAYRYFAGETPMFGSSARICTRVDSNPGNNGVCFSSAYMQDFPSVAAALDGERYRSPATESCQPNYIVFLTDGLPTKDTQANGDIRALLEAANATLPAGERIECEGSGDGGCLSALTEYMAKVGLPSGATVKSYFIGFGGDYDGNLENAFAYLERAASAGDGIAYQANDFSSLSGVFNTIITSILQTSTTFTAPTVAVNAFNRTETLDHLFVSVFQPNSTVHWPGNLKKYEARRRPIAGTNPEEFETVIVDADGNNAINSSTGFFRDGARSFWSTTADGSTVTAGGAASRIPDPDARNLYTYLGNTISLTPSSLSGYPISDTLDPELFALGETDPPLSDLVDWARGVDVRNEDGDSTTLTRKVMGDPIHSPPAVVIYGGTEENPEAVAFITTNDGYLHAFDAQSGEELWAFIPREYLPFLKELYEDGPVASKTYALDGEISVLKYDVDDDGIVDRTDGDRVLIYFGVGRGGSQYYALDVTDRNDPKYIWTIGPAQLPGVGQTWSTPKIERVNIAGETQNSQKFVLIFGGGYDPAQDGVVVSTGDSVGNRIYMVDALRGTLLWSAGPSDADLNLPRMTHSIPSPIAVLDTNADRFADRMYVGDMGGQVWRFDIHNGQDADELVTGGVIASLGAKDAETPAEANARRFYNAPDVAPLEKFGSRPFFNIAIGSGFRGAPLNTGIQDRFYAIHDTQPYAVRTDYSEDAIIFDSDLQDITTDFDAVVPPASPGWKLLLNYPAWQGEKVLNASTTVNNIIKFTTYIPRAESEENANQCTISSTGRNRIYQISAFNGAPPEPPNQDTEGGGENEGGGGDGNGDDPSERYEDLEQGGIAPKPSILFPEENAITCLVGVEVLNSCKDFNSRIKTYWRESNAP